MDFNKFDARAAAETGAAMQIVDPYTSEPITDGDNPCRVLVRGIASPSLQKAQREKAKAAAAKAKKAADDASDDARVMEDVHNEMIEAAIPFVAGFENVSRGDQPLTAKADDVRWFLNLSFPSIGAKLDSDGNPVLDDDGSPQFESKNKTFAAQVIEFAGEQENFTGKPKKG